MERQIDHLIRLIDDLLDVSRVNTGKLEMRREPMSIKEVISYVLEVSAPLIEDSGHTPEFDLPPNSLYVEVDRVRIGQVLTNVLHNACKYTPAGGDIRVEVKEENGEAVISVIDNGIGIDPATLPMLFEMFSQADSSRDLRKGGIGIGLSLARKLVEMHGGTITASSPGANKGSTFTIRIPVCKAPAIVAEDTLPPSSANASARAHRVLIVDDNADAAQLFASLLAMCGHSIEVAHTGAEALAKAKSFVPEIVFLDIGLPDMSGLEVAKTIRQAPSLCGVKLIALTGWGSARDQAATAEAGFDLHFTKPISLDAIRVGLPDLELPQSH
jgi:CheY-like chemotaxis protein/anti-sigma regulatory factor (Ser/Thr protein kinase)